jgi:pimeloyl-ACP methyl ester carboxylesterase
MEFAVDGHRVFAGTGGRAHDPALPTLVMLHGAAMDHTVWAMQARGLAHRGRNVLALDFPGHGGSGGAGLSSIGAMADWVLSVLAARGIDRFRIAGHSMGALVALETAGRAGARVEAAALVGMMPQMRVHPDLLADARAGAHNAVDLMISWSLGPRGLLGGNPAPGLSIAAAGTRLLERGLDTVLAGDLAACEAYQGAAEAAARVTAPTLFLLGGSDRMTPAGRAAAFAATMPTARVTTLAGIGHMIPLEAPAATLAALSNAL